jgi:8-oxo-dGTP pyrophosphatase MutT (NUDIX family)
MIPGIHKGVAGNLSPSNAVAALIQLEDGRYLMQHRDDVPSIWFPGHWGCFGGAVDEGESPLGALKRELREEIEFEVHEAKYFTRFDFDMTELGLRRFYRIYYLITITKAECERIVLHEGQSFEAFPVNAIFDTLCVAPYDAFALFLHHSRHQFGNTSQGKPAQ